MACQGFDLGRLIRPLEPGRLFAEDREKKPLIISRKQSDYYAARLSLPAMNLDLKTGKVVGLF